jgi:hypothetical protein
VEIIFDSDLTDCVTADPSAMVELYQYIGKFSARATVACCSARNDRCVHREGGRVTKGAAGPVPTARLVDKVARPDDIAVARSG